MNNKSIKEFSERNDTDVDVIVLKEEGDFGTGFTLCLSAYIKQLKGIIVQCETWKEEELIKELNASYSMVKDFYKDDMHIDLPEKLNYFFTYVNEDEWISSLKLR